jgi:glycosyltransferase involved in cell wall biosynthesis
MSFVSKQPGIALVVPKAGSAVAEHFAHTVALSEQLAELLPTTVIVERVTGEAPITAPSVRLIQQKRVDDGPVRRAREIWAIGRRLLDERPHAFFVRTSQTAAVPLALLTKTRGGRTLYWNCGMAPRNRVRDLRSGPLLRGELAMRAAYLLADLVVTGTPSLADHYASTYRIPRRRLAVLPNEVDLRKFRPPSPPERAEARARLGVGNETRVVLLVHRLSPVRRTGFYLPALAQKLTAEAPGSLLVIAGDGPERATLEADLRKRGLSSNVIWLGAIAHAEIRWLYRAADAFVMASWTEGFPRVLIEAMAMGIPVASTDVGGVHEIVPPEYAMRLVPRTHPERLADAVLQLLHDRVAAATLARRGAAWVERYDAPVVARELASLVQDVCADSE